MRIADENIKEIIKRLETLGYSQGVETVFRDWCECAALALANGCDVLHGETWVRREKRYMSIVKKYNKPELFPEMFALLTDTFEADPWKDHLGRIYMECFGGNKGLGQCFTPESVCECCAAVAGVPANGEPATVGEPACGGGAMIIAYLKRCYEAGYDYQRLLTIHATDLDSLCVHMCYIQLSLLGARAIIQQADSIKQQVYDTFVTPYEALYPIFAFTGLDVPTADKKPQETKKESTETHKKKPEQKKVSVPVQCCLF